YGAAIGWSLEHRKTTLAAALGLLVGSFLLVPVIGAEFVPKSDNDRFSISIKTAPGATLEYTEAKARDIETRLRKYPEVR
ncbi:efflux RND transporter permease subunit, partial [Staphylococcus aureus]|nr:efflux RND transporter permease subunit [Staphylococcus aureus]